MGGEMNQREFTLRLRKERDEFVSEKLALALYQDFLRATGMAVVHRGRESITAPDFREPLPSERETCSYCKASTKGERCTNCGAARMGEK